MVGTATEQGNPERAFCFHNIPPGATVPSHSKQENSTESWAVSALGWSSHRRELQAPLAQTLRLREQNPPGSIANAVHAPLAADTPFFSCSCWQELSQTNGVFMAIWLQRQLSSSGRTESTQQARRHRCCSQGKPRLTCQVG